MKVIDMKKYRDELECWARDLAPPLLIAAAEILLFLGLVALLLAVWVRLGVQ